MANQLAALPWVLDTPDAAALYSSKVKIDHIDFVGYSDPSHVAELQDENGHLVALLQGNSDLSVVTSYECVGWVSGILLPLTLTSGGGANLQSGKLIVYIK